MKKSITMFVAAGLSAASLALAQTAAPPTRAAAPAVPAVAPTKIAIIDVTKTILGTKEGQKAAAELQGKFNPRKAALEKRQADIGALQDQIKKGGSTMNEGARDKIMREIDANTRALNHDADDLNADVEQEQNKLMGDLGQKMMAILDQYAAQNGIAVVLDVSNQQSPVFWAASATNVTEDIVRLYDQAHPASGAAAAPPAARPPAAKSAAPSPAPKPPVPPATKKQ